MLAARSFKLRLETPAAASMPPSAPLRGRLTPSIDLALTRRPLPRISALTRQTGTTSKPQTIHHRAGAERRTRRILRDMATWRRPARKPVRRYFGRAGFLVTVLAAGAAGCATEGPIVYSNS